MIGTDSLSNGAGATFELFSLSYASVSETIFNYDTRGSLTGSETTNLAQPGKLVTPVVSIADAGGTYNGTASVVSAATVTTGGTTVASFGDPSLTYTYYAGTFRSAAELASVAALPGAPSNVGGYTVVGHYSTSNPLLYANADSAPVNFSIAPAPLTVTADPNQGKAYGDADPILTDHLTSGTLYGADTVSGFPTRAPGENVGVYSISQGTLSAGSNYTLTFDSNSFTIGARPITVTAAAQTKVYGTLDPTLTDQLSSGSLVGRDHLSGSLVRDPGNDVGLYAIRQGTLTAGANYAITFLGANLTITAAPTNVTLVPSAATAAVNQPVTFTASVTASAGNGIPSGLILFEDGATVLRTVPLVGSTAAFTTSGLAPGRHTIQAVYVAARDFASPAAPASLAETVMQATLEPDPLHPGQTALFIGGSSNNDTITVDRNGGRDTVRITQGRTSTFTGSFTAILSRVVVYAGTGNETIIVAPSVKTDAWLFAGAGHNLLIGGAGNDVLVGGAGNNILVAGSGRDLLIAGSGNAVLFGGRGDDLLVGGSTIYSANDQALLALMSEWTRRDADYATRVGHITGTLADGKGLNRPDFLNASTVHAGGHDLVFGNTGNTLYFAGLADFILGRRRNDTLVAI